MLALSLVGGKLHKENTLK